MLERITILDLQDAIPFDILRDFINSIVFLQIQFNLNNVLFFSAWKEEKDQFVLRITGEIDGARINKYVDYATEHWHAKILLNPELEKWII